MTNGSFENSCQWVSLVISISVLVPTVSYCWPLSPQEILQDQWIGLTEAPAKSLLFLWVLVHTRACVCVCPPRVEFLFLSTLWSSCDQAPLTFQSQVLWGLLFPVLEPQSGGPYMGLWTLLQWESLCDIIIFQFGSFTCWVCDLIVLWMHPSFHLVVASSLSLDVEHLFWEVWVFLVDGYSAVSCDFGVFVREGELKSFYSTIYSQTSKKKVCRGGISKTVQGVQWIGQCNKSILLW